MALLPLKQYQQALRRDTQDTSEHGVRMPWRAAAVAAAADMKPPAAPCPEVRVRGLQTPTIAALLPPTLPRPGKLHCPPDKSQYTQPV